MEVLKVAQRRVVEFDVLYATSLDERFALTEVDSRQFSHSRDGVTARLLP